MTFWTGNLWVIDETGKLIFKLVCNRWVERRPGLHTGADTLHRLLRKHIPAYRKVTEGKRTYGSFIRTLGSLYDGTDIIFLHMPGFKEEFPGGEVYFWEMFYDGLHMDRANGKVVPNQGQARSQLLEERGLTILDNPDAPVYVIGATIR